MSERNGTIQLFYCVNSMTEAEVEDLHGRLGVNGVKTLSLPCSGKAMIPYLLKAFEKGAAGVVVCACPESQCKHLEGNLRASRRAESVARLLDEIGLGEGRVLVVTKEPGGIEELLDGIRRLQAVGSVPVGASNDVPEGARANEPGRTVLTNGWTDQRRENAA